MLITENPKIIGILDATLFGMFQEGLLMRQKKVLTFLTTILGVTLTPLISFADAPSITGVAVLDSGLSGSASFEIDSNQEDCEPDPTVEDLEAFSDTMLSLTFNNPSYVSLRIKRVVFTVYDVGTGTRLVRSSRQVPVSGSFIDSVTTDHKLVTFMADVVGTDKYFVGDETPLSGRTGLREIRIAARGVDSIGRRVRLRARTTVSVDNYDRCGS